MKSICIHMPALLDKVIEMSEDNMAGVKLSICEEAVDQGQVFPAFLHFEAYAKDGSVKDYESVDSITVFFP